MPAAITRNGSGLLLAAVLLLTLLVVFGTALIAVLSQRSSKTPAARAAWSAARRGRARTRSPQC